MNLFDLFLMALAASATLVITVALLILLEVLL
jgi:hypothetical protein